MQKKIDRHVEILGVRVTGTEKDRVLRRIFLQRKNLLHVATVNSEFIMQARKSKKFAEVLAQADETVADGWGVVWAARILHGVWISRITGVELVDLVLERAATEKKKVFLLGAGSGVAEKAASAMQKEYPGVEIGVYEGSRNIKKEERAEMGLTLAKINSFEPDFLLVAYGSPWQDFWIEENREYLRAKVAIGVGGVLDEWAGVVRKCPKFLDRMGLKWLWRLVQDPWRWKRQLNIWHFVMLVWWEKIKISIRS